jgi:RNA polymerase sigma-70 factor (ECF subfamily)
MSTAEGEIVAGLAAEQERFLAFLRRRLGDRDAAEDVLQAAYLKALASRATLRDRSSVVAWFFRILRRAATDHRRRESARGRATAARGAQALAAREREDRAVLAAVCHCVEGLLPGLPPAQREVLRRVDLQGESPAEAATALGITPANASVRLHRARAALRGRLQALCGTCTRHRCLDCRCRGRDGGAV